MLGYLVPKLLPRSPRLSLPTITMLTKTSVTVIKVITTTITLAMGKVEVEAAREDSIDRDLLLKGKPYAIQYFFHSAIFMKDFPLFKPASYYIRSR